jgi:hypothetical protein
MAELLRPGRRAAAITIARIMGGKPFIRSVNRISRLSHTPPKKPATEPKVIPITIETRTMMTAIGREMRPPCMTQLRISRPNPSVPMGCCRLGGLRRLGKSCFKGS